MSDCDCACERPEFYSHTVPRSSKLRQCDDCHSPIRSGERYHRHSGKWDHCSGVETWVICFTCEAWRDALEESPWGCECVALGGLGESLVEFSEEKFRFEWQGPREYRGAVTMGTA